MSEGESKFKFKDLAAMKLSPYKEKVKQLAQIRSLADFRSLRAGKSAGPVENSPEVAALPEKEQLELPERVSFGYFIPRDRSQVQLFLRAVSEAVSPSKSEDSLNLRVAEVEEVVRKIFDGQSRFASVRGGYDTGFKVESFSDEYLLVKCKAAEVRGVEGLPTWFNSKAIEDKNPYVESLNPLYQGENPTWGAESQAELVELVKFGQQMLEKMGVDNRVFRHEIANKADLLESFLRRTVGVEIMDQLVVEFTQQKGIEPVDYGGTISKIGEIWGGLFEQPDEVALEFFNFVLSSVDEDKQRLFLRHMSFPDLNKRSFSIARSQQVKVGDVEGSLEISLQLNDHQAKEVPHLGVRYDVERRELVPLIDALGSVVVGVTFSPHLKPGMTREDLIPLQKRANELVAEYWQPPSTYSRYA